MLELINFHLDNCEGLKFEKVNYPLSRRPDLHAFILLDRIMPSDRDIVEAAEHDVIYLSIDVDKLAEVITEEQLLELLRCGVSYDSQYDCLYLFT